MLAAGHTDPRPALTAQFRYANGISSGQTLPAVSLVPGCQFDAWMSDYAMPQRAVAPEEQIWSNIMDPAAAAKFLGEQL